MVEDSIRENSIEIHSTPWYHNKFFKYGCGILLVQGMVFMCYQLAFLLAPLGHFISYLFIPIVLSILFHYLLRPAVDFFGRLHVPRVLSILIVYCLIFTFLFLFIAYFGSVLAEQATAFTESIMHLFEKIEFHMAPNLTENLSVDLKKQLEQNFIGLAQKITTLVGQNFLDMIGFVTKLGTTIAVIPFIVFYLLKDGHVFARGFIQNVPATFRLDATEVIEDLDSTLSNYLNGLVIISLAVGGMLFVSYSIIGLKYPLILSVIALIVTTIPFIGPFLAIIPAILVGLSTSAFMTLKVAIVFLIVQQLESNFISPQVIGNKLDIHPLSILLILLAAGALYGFIGLLLATPTYAVLKVLTVHAYRLYKLRYEKIQEKLSSPG